MPMSEIIPAILPHSTDELKRELSRIPEEVPMIHVDVVDENIFFDPPGNFEVHLMVSDPDKIVDGWAKAGAKRIIVHKLTDKIKSLRPKVKIGLAVELEQPLEEIFPLVPEADYVHLMSIEEIGAQGHEFEPKIFDKIKELSDRFPELVISVDGGVNLDNADDLLAMGVDRLVVGSAIFNAKDPLEAYINFLKVLN